MSKGTIMTLSNASWHKMCKTSAQEWDRDGQIVAQSICCKQTTKLGTTASFRMSCHITQISMKALNVCVNIELEVVAYKVVSNYCLKASRAIRISIEPSEKVTKNLTPGTDKAHEYSGL